MDLRCFKCNKKCLDLPEAIKHLKIIHLIKENVDDIFCLRPNCKKSYRTFKTLKAHIDKCTQQNPSTLISTEVRVVYDLLNIINIKSNTIQTDLFTKFIFIVGTIH